MRDTYVGIIYKGTLTDCPTQRTLQDIVGPFNSKDEAETWYCTNSYKYHELGRQICYTRVKGAPNEK